MRITRCVCPECFQKPPIERNSYSEQTVAQLGHVAVSRRETPSSVWSELNPLATIMPKNIRFFCPPPCWYRWLCFVCMCLYDVIAVGVDEKVRQNSAKSCDNCESSPCTSLVLPTFGNVPCWIRRMTVQISSPATRGSKEETLHSPI